MKKNSFTLLNEAKKLVLEIGKAGFRIDSGPASLLYQLADLQGAKDYCYPSQHYLADLLQCTSRSIRKYVSYLEALSLIKKGKDVKFICVGKKGKAALSREFGESIIEFFDFSDVRNLGFAEGDSIAKKIISLFNEDSFDVCQLYYSKFESVLTQIPTEQTIIPFGLNNESNEDILVQEACYEYEPDEVDILRDLLPKNLSIQVFRALLENFASEQGARMSAMDNATRNANEMIDKLKITYNRSRQATITSELIEIISGAEAL